MYTFHKSEKLCSFQQINTLFGQGKAFFQYPFRIVYFCITDAGEHSIENMPKPYFDKDFIFPAKCLISVSSRKYKRAVDRNRIKRLVREGYRHNKAGFYAFLKAKNARCLLAFVYTGKEIVSAPEMSAKIKLSLHKLQEHIETESMVQQSN